MQRAVGKPVNVVCFENGSDNLYPNPLIGSQCGLLRAHKASEWTEEETRGVSQRAPCTPGQRGRFSAL